MYVLEKVVSGGEGDGIAHRRAEAAAFDSRWSDHGVLQLRCDVWRR